MAVKKSKKTTTGMTAALAAENERFRACVAARSRVSSLNADVGKWIQLKDESPYAKRRWYRDWRQQLEGAGFQFARHLTIFLAEYTAFTNAELGFDAFLSEGDRPGCEVVAYHDDQTATTAANFAALVGGPFAPPSRAWHEFKKTPPAALVERLQELVRGKKLLRIDASGCASRFTEVVNRAEHEIGEQALQLLKTPTVFIDGAPARWERLGYYCDFEGAGGKSPRCSTADCVRDWQQEFAEADDNPPDSTDDAVDAAMKLAAASHFQFASEPDPNELLAPASDAAVAHFKALAGAGKKEIIAAPVFQFRALLRGLLLCALAGRWETFKEICNLVEPKLASANTADDEDLDFAQVLLLLVSSYRDRPLPKAAALEQGVAKRLAKVPRLLLDVWRAIDGGRAKDVEQALRNSLEYFMELRGDKLVPAQRLQRRKWNDPFRFIALPESLFHLAARERGLQLSPLEPHFADMLITPETIGVM